MKWAVRLGGQLFLFLGNPYELKMLRKDAQSTFFAFGKNFIEEVIDKQHKLG